MSLPTLMVLDGEVLVTLGIVRSFGRKGIPVMVGSVGYGSGFSRYARRRFSYPSPEGGMAAAHSKIIGMVGMWRPDVLMPVFPRGWSIIYAFYDEYARLTEIVPNPGRELFENLSDKGRLVDYAKKYGVQIPMTLRPQTLKHALELRESLPYPVLLKPRKSQGGVGIRMARNAGEFVGVLKQFQEVPLIQEQIQGEDLELTILCVAGKPNAGSAYLSLRNSPLPYGPPVACRTIKEKHLMHIGMDFLRKLRYHGLAHLDFRRDRRDGKVKLLDFNPRFAGTNDISLCSGVDFAFMLYQLVLGKTIRPCFANEVGREFRWILRELKYLTETDHKIRTVRELLRWHNVSTDLSLADPLPHVTMVFKRLYTLIEKVRNRIMPT